METGRWEVLSERIEEEEEEEKKEVNEAEEAMKGVILGRKELQELEKELSQIEVHIPDVPLTFTKSSIDTSELPLSYKTNSPKEEQLLQVADNFCRQYAHLCPDREPLFLRPLNECDVEQKFVSTTVRPTLMPYPELYNWDSCARFVSDYLTMLPLPSPLKPPSYMYSPTTILKHQKGNCFDFSTLLCSLLIGAGYDAYCVNGYSTREICLMDLSREVCPLLKVPKEVPEASEAVQPRKYSIRPPRDLRSKFELQQMAKNEAKIAAAQEKKRKEELERTVEEEKPQPDSMHGLRVHAWVLVLSGKREVPESFFIDPFTAISYSTTDEHFLGIESLWNHKNYWVNMQDCWNGCQDLVFDLGDPLRWEFLLLGTDKPLLLLSDLEEEEDLGEDDVDNLDKEEEERGFDMPHSWVGPIQITPKEFETRCPQGKKVIQYKKAKLEKWAPYLNSNGLVSRLTSYEDMECSKVVEVKEWYKNREDMLEMKQVNKLTGVITEYFKPGRIQALRVHTYKTMIPETERTMEFYSAARVDGLLKRIENPLEIIEHYEGRADFLSYRHVEFGKRIKKLGGIVTTESNARPVMKITERFYRNPEKSANDDVAERVFLVSEERIQLKYHRNDDYITASKREFIKRAEVDNKGNKIIMTPDMCISYEVEPRERANSLLYQYEMMMRLVDEEKIVKHQVWESEIEERLQHEEHQRQVEMDMDYLAPFLMQLPPGEKMTRWQVLRLKENCLNDFKQRLIDKANLIQARFEKETKELQKKQQWYQENQVTMTVEDEDAYLSYCSEVMFRIRILELRLNRHKEQAPQKYLALEEKLFKDPRLGDYLKVFS
ncbi:dynein regulatory complex subunit 7 isoform X3 [Tachyglossus aculeatus]|uniref:dynein regulatory complex subunit 7 isoform X3 n=1 Tax=Tachyglossus aculeatus TaxID=9261 RepID=UPI0018F6C428|nr:dynein regulatory complex subunit 7 isoform X3 [Tachyglossus aculeatus]